MAFRDLKQADAAPDSPEKLFPDLPRRKIPGVLPHQHEQMKAYSESAIDASDVAIQLPTGSGKTLVGLLIGEWRRRKFGERIVYLAPTKQLVNQVVEQAEETYGITAHAFVGSAKDYELAAKADYKSGAHIAVTTYSSLFNVNPFFDDADVIIMDDAHSAENYVSAMWSMKIDRNEPSDKVLHAALCAVLKPLIEPFNYSRLQGEIDSPSDRSWVEKLPTPVLHEISDQLTAVLDEHSKGLDVSYAWQMVKGHLGTCHLYMSSQEILIRPIVPPTWTHQAFVGAKQRMYMSATLGSGGDLERLVGRSNILRLPISAGLDSHGVGRRFFIFPGMSLGSEAIKDLRLKMMQIAKRSLMLVPNSNVMDIMADEVKTGIGYDVFGVGEIEKSKKPFVESESAVAIVANRYDGIDFPGNQCRLLFIDGLPRAMNLQERFIMSKMGANVIFNERIQTRVLQAIGRCTRSLEDYSAVVVSGEELPDYLSDSRRSQYLHPELQAELLFGVEQSKAIDSGGLLENLKTFLDNGEEWEKVNEQILTSRKGMAKLEFPAMSELQSSVVHEIKYQEKMWQGDYEAALAEADLVLAELKTTELRGYRALWHYLAGSAAWLAFKDGSSILGSRAKEEYTKAKDAAPMLPWLVTLSRYIDDSEASDPEEDNTVVLRQIENIESIFSRLGPTYTKAYVAREKQILEGLLSEDTSAFEEAHKQLGEMLGFESDNQESDGSPDPWWISVDKCLVFEDHSGAQEGTAISVSKARQVQSHPAWMQTNVTAAKTADILPVLITPSVTVKKGAKPHLSGVALWNLSDFQLWAKEAIAVVRDLRGSFTESGDIVWRSEAVAVLKGKGIDAVSLVEMLKQRPAESLLKEVD